MSKYSESENSYDYHKERKFKKGKYSAEKISKKLADMDDRYATPANRKYSLSEVAKTLKKGGNVGKNER
jgi:CRISPR/Cas system CSM-associated protein Csm2 small subunit